MTPLHVLNISGILLDGRNDGIERSLRKRLPSAGVETFAPIPLPLVRESLATLLRRLGEHIDGFLDSLSDAAPAPRLVGIGRSFGGFMLLAAAAQDRRRLEAFSLLVAVEAPLAPDVHVGIPPLLPMLLMGAHHFQERPHYARQMLDDLQSVEGSNLLTIATKTDVIPFESQQLSPSQAVITWPGEPLPSRCERAHGTHVILGPFPPGFAIETALLPTNYRSHLTWSEDKHAAIVDVIRAALA